MESNGGLLENLYLRRSNGKRSATADRRDTDQERTMRILEAYRALIRGQSPGELERLGRIPDWLWKGMKEIGLFGLNIPEHYGGKGLSLRGYLRIIEEMARTDLALAIIPTAHLSIGIKGILLFGNNDQKRRYLPRAASGEMIFAYALTEPGVGSDAQHIETSAELSEDGTCYILNGTKTYITNGGYAGAFTVFARMKGEHPGTLSAFIVDANAEGIAVGKDMPKMGLHISSTTSISFSGVCVPKANLLGKPGQGFRIAMTILNYGRLGLGAASSGVMRQSIDDMLRRASTRRQFGVPIGSFPLIQEKIAQAEVNATVAAAMTALTSELLENDPLAPVAIESSHTKLFGTTRAWNTLYDALQVAGGAGYLRTLPYEKRMRDFRVTTVFEGTTEIHSIYPPLYLLRAMEKELKTSRFRSLGLVCLIGRQFTARAPAYGFAPKDAREHRALRFVKESSRSVRRLLILGLLRYGRNITHQEFLLRRITTVSLYGYGTLSLLHAVAGGRKSGHGVESKLRVLEGFLEEARTALGHAARLADSPYERILTDIFRHMETTIPGETADTAPRPSEFPALKP